MSRCGAGSPRDGQRADASTRPARADVTERSPRRTRPRPRRSGDDTRASRSLRRSRSGLGSTSRKGRRSTRTFPLAWARPRAGHLKAHRRPMRRRVTVAFGLEATFVLAQMSSLGRCSVDGVYERSKTRTTYLTLVRHGVEQHGCEYEIRTRRRWIGPARKISLAFPRHATEDAHHAESLTWERLAR